MIKNQKPRLKTKRVKYEDDQQLVMLAKKDNRAFSLIYERYFERIYLFVYKRVRDEAIAGDVTQDAMLKAMMALPKYEDRGAPFSSWLFRIASNEVNLHFRKAKKMIQVAVQEKDVQTIMEEIEIKPTEDEQSKLIRLLGDMKPAQTEIIEMRFFMHYSFKEIADFYNISEASAKMRVYRILEKLKNSWDKQ
jgi:RNA polymerase sigma-70 factor, ECF subfamily